MNKASDSMIRNRLADKWMDATGEDFSPLDPYIEGRAMELARLTLVLRFTPTESERHYQTCCRIDDLMFQMQEEYFADNEAMEYVIWQEELKEAEEEARRDEAAEKAYWEKAA